MNKLSIAPTKLGQSIALALYMIAMTAPSWAQENDKKQNKNALLEVIEIKARKMRNSEPVQQTPLAVTAFGEKQLDALNVSDLSDLSFTSPNVQFEEIGTIPGVQNFSFRGQGINSSIPSVDPTVGTFIDGMFLGTSYGVVIDMFDMESIEILRGPQGILFGRNVTGGAVNIRTKRPDEEFNISFKANATDANERTIAATVEGSLIEDKLRAKAVVYRNDDNGYFDYVGSGQVPGAFYFTEERNPTGEMETQFFRGTLVLDASDELELTLIGETGSMEGDGAAWQSTQSLLDAASGEYLSDMDRAALSNPLNEFETAGDEGGLTDGDWSHLIFETNYEIGEVVLTNIFAWREVSMYSAFDLDGSPTPIFSLGTSTAQNQLSNELRFAGVALDGKFDYTFGHYYFQQEVEYLEGRSISGGAIRVALGGEMDHTTTGVFVSGDYHLSERLTVTGGLRYTEEEKETSIITTENGACREIITFEGCEYIDLDRKWESVTPKVGLDYKFSDDVLIYTFWTKGFRSGGVNFRNAKPNLYNPGPTDAESQNAYELGLKSDLLDDRLRLNVAYFFNEISDMQREINVGDPDVIVLQATLTAGDAEIQGIEADFAGVITDNFTLAGSVGFLDGDYTYKVPETEGQFGDDLPRLAELSYALTANYNLNLEDNGFVDFQVGYSYRDSTAYTDSNNAYLPEAKEVSFDVTWSNLDGNLAVSLYGKNMLDEARWGNLSGSQFWGPMQKGRRIGIEVEYSLW